MASTPQPYELNLDAVEDRVALVYQACEPQIRCRRMSDEQAAAYVAAVSDQIRDRVQRDRPDQYAKLKQAMTRAKN
jgi:hypothetical protein